MVHLTPDFFDFIEYTLKAQPQYNNRQSADRRKSMANVHTNKSKQDKRDALGDVSEEM